MSIDLLQTDPSTLQKELPAFVKEVTVKPNNELTRSIYEEANQMIELLSNPQLSQFEATRQYVRLWLERAKRDVREGNRVQAESVRHGSEYYTYMDQAHHRARLRMAQQLIGSEYLHTSELSFTVVEIAAGIGKFADYTKELEKQKSKIQPQPTHLLYLPVDLDIEPLSKIDKREPKLQASAAELPFPDNSLDVVYAGELIEHLSPQLLFSFFQEAFRVLKPGGLFLLTTPNFASIPAQLEMAQGKFPRTVDERRSEEPSAWASEHITMFTGNSLSEFLQYFGFDIDTLTTNQVTLRLEKDEKGKLYPSQVVRFEAGDDVSFNEAKASADIGDSLILAAKKPAI
ncbi:hypothetical protein C5B42_05120 [Candidatus Cerribacteria bacterium 'Amazon FNV 2010 28 9']|uniref:Methyltransferase type 11 domain-containing protein n=1 Tax=Candidatus Cerribacteria bacterium 'Amazon FNV 2010 28 9' TaxID=2081795 RepID=A0A317JNL1_9BACT|nr:MAG: hypothetical protein C5B42_05120 [Candidatus Cerribacteria bacterium 'Amazon FNV 2010 28 9']